MTRKVPRQEIKVDGFPMAAKDPFSYFAKVIREELKVEKTDLSSLENNLIVVKILDAARQSAAEEKTILFKK